MGTNDLAKETRARFVPGRAPMHGWLTTCVLAARTYGIDILDGVYNNLGDMDGFACECAEGRDFGFDGKTLIHPESDRTVNAAFSPSTDEVPWRARSSPHSTSRKIRAKASCRWKAAWSSSCTPRSPAARSR